MSQTVTGRITSTVPSILEVSKGDKSWVQEREPKLVEVVQLNYQEYEIRLLEAPKK